MTRRWEDGKCNRCNEEKRVTGVTEGTKHEWICWDCLDRLENDKAGPWTVKA